MNNKKNLILGLVVVVLLAGAALALFRDSIFSSSAQPKDEAANAAAATVGNATGAAQGVEPDPPNPPPRGSGKKLAPAH